LQQQQQMGKSVDDVSDVIDEEELVGMSEEEKARARAVHKRRSASDMFAYMNMYSIQYSK